MRILLLLFFVSALLQVNAQSMADMTSEASSQFDIADKNLNTAYKDLLMEYKDYPNFIEKLKNAQKLWIKYRDALIDMQFPSNEPTLDYGSMYSLCLLDYKTELTNNRTKELLNYMKYEEGEGCVGGPVD